jgi:hypothetical protein
MIAFDNFHNFLSEHPLDDLVMIVALIVVMATSFGHLDEVIKFGFRHFQHELEINDRHSFDSLEKFLCGWQYVFDIATVWITGLVALIGHVRPHAVETFLDEEATVTVDIYSMKIVNLDHD